MRYIFPYNSLIRMMLGKAYILSYPLHPFHNALVMKSDVLQYPSGTPRFL